MALVIEDGTGKSDATSYVTVAEARAYALARGVTLSAVDADVEVLILKTMDYIESYRERFKGWKKTKEQALQWPRYDVYIDGWHQESEDIPQLLKNAVCQAVMEVNNGTDPMPTGTGNAVISEKVDVIEVEYAAATSSAPSPVMRKVNALLNPLLSGGGSYVFRS